MSDTDTRSDVAGHPRDFAGKNALVTCGSRGIGRAVCLELAQRGADVAFIYRSRDAEAEAVAAQIRTLGRRALALKTDLAQAAEVGAAVDRAAAELGRLDVLVQAAGAMGVWRETAELSVEDWDRYLAVDLSGAFYAIRASLPQTYFAWSGPTTNGSAAYFRVQGPTLVIEYAPQGGVDHIHTIYRDPTNDYGAKFARR